MWSSVHYSLPIGRIRAIWGLVALLGLVAGLFWLPRGAQADASVARASSSPKAVLVIVAYGLRPETVFASRDPRLVSVLQGASLGLMNTSTAGARGRADGYASLASGARALGGQRAGFALSASEVYQGVGAATVARRRGVKLPAAMRAEEGLLPGSTVESAVHLGVSEAVTLNLTDNTSYGGRPGIVGDALKRANVLTAVLGTADEGQVLHREASLLVAGSDGAIANASFQAEPFRATLRRLESWLSHTGGGRRSLTILELGRGNQAMLAERLAQAMEVARGPSGDTSELDILFVSPGPRGGSSTDSLTPVILLSPASEGADRVLASPSTKRAGVILNADVAPTVLKLLGVAIPDGVTGKAAFSLKPASLAGRSAGEWLLAVRASAVAKSELRRVFVTAYVAYLALVLLYLTVLCVVKGRRGSVPAPAKLPVAPLLVLWCPLAFLALAYWSPQTVPEYAVALVLAMALAVAVGPRLVRSPLLAATYVAMSTCVVIAADQLTRGSLVARTVMSYDIQSGSRFYGLGNEYAGLLIGAFIFWLGATSELRRLSKEEVVVGSIMVCTTIGAPILGANYVGLLTAVVGFGATGLLLSRRKLSLWALLGLLGVGLFAVALMLAVDLALNRSGSTHLGDTVLQMASEGVREAARLVTRKLAMSLRIVAYTPWNYVFMAALGSLVFITRRASPLRQWQAMAERHPGLSMALRGSLVASVLALLVEDSGVVASSLVMIYPFYGFAFVVLGEGRKHESARTGRRN